MRDLRDELVSLGKCATVFLLAAAVLAAQSGREEPLRLAARACEPAWLPAFGQPSGLNGSAYVLQAFDDGLSSGPVLYVAGAFGVAGTEAVSNIARWDGVAWSALGLGLDGVGHALAVFDEGSGPALYVGGDFDHAGGLGVANIARWDGRVWSSVGGGLAGRVRALAVHDDGQGGGPALYVGGSFPNRIARWTGAAWLPVGGGFGDEGGDEVRALLVHDDGRGGGPQLYAGGNFKASDGAPGNRIARWDGLSWHPLGSGISPLGGGETSVAVLATFDDGSGAGPRLYAGGHFNSAGGLHANNIACWDGVAWSALGGGFGAGFGTSVLALATFDAGSGDDLYAGGSSTTAGSENVLNVARWDGSSWSAVAGGLSNQVRALQAFDPPGPDGPRLFAGGDFVASEKTNADHVAAFDGVAWSGLGVGFNGPVRAAVVFDDGSGDGPALYVAGAFAAAGGVSCDEVARWDGSAWSPLDTSNSVTCLVVHDDGLGGGPALYSGGNGVRRWDGESWLSTATFTGGVVTALASFDPPGAEPRRLYACGPFTGISGQPVTHIAAWDGLAWSDLGTVMNDWVLSMAVIDDGAGPSLYVGGKFTFTGGLLASRVARWDGTTWHALAGGLGGGPDATPECFALYDDGRGDGPVLFVGGSFTIAGGAPASRLARWDGTAWSSAGLEVAGAAPVVQSLAVFADADGQGDRLFAGGAFDAIAGVPAANVAGWDGASWSPLAGGAPAVVHVLAVHDDGNGAGPRLWVGGDFKTLAETDDAYLGVWGGCTPGVSPWTDLGFALAGTDGLPQLVGSGPLFPATAGALSLAQAAPSAFAPLFVSLTGSPAPFKGGVLVPLPALLTLPLATSPAGSLALSWSSWPGGLSGLSVYFQQAIVDAAAPNGVALSNALRADVP